jgi:hypothetical protein
MATATRPHEEHVFNTHVFQDGSDRSFVAAWLHSCMAWACQFLLSSARRGVAAADRPEMLMVLTASEMQVYKKQPTDEMRRPELLPISADMSVGMPIDTRPRPLVAVARILCSACSARGICGTEACFGDFKIRDWLPMRRSTKQNEVHNSFHSEWQTKGSWAGAHDETCSCVSRTRCSLPLP